MGIPSFGVLRAMRNVVAPLLMPLLLALAVPYATCHGALPHLLGAGSLFAASADTCRRRTRTPPATCRARAAYNPSQTNAASLLPSLGAGFSPLAASACHRFSYMGAVSTSLVAQALCVVRPARPCRARRAAMTRGSHKFSRSLQPRTPPVLPACPPAPPRARAQLRGSLQELHHSIMNDRYLVGNKLHNFDRDGAPAPPLTA